MLCLTENVSVVNPLQYLLLFAIYGNSVAKFRIDMLKLDFPVERSIDGVSLASVLYGEKDIREKPMVFHYQEKMSWITQNYKLVSINEGETFELYNLLNDPGESKKLLRQNLKYNS